MQIEDLLILMAGLVGALALVAPGGVAVGGVMFAAAALGGACRYPWGAGQETADASAAGRPLTGACGDLFRLHRAPREIRALSRPFYPAALLPAHLADRVAGLIPGTAAARSRVENGDGKPFSFVRRRAVTTLEPVG